MEILLWLAPAAVVTLAAMLWAGWRGRERRIEVDRDEAVRRLGAALARPTPRRARGSAEVAPPAAERVTGVARRRPMPGTEDRRAS